MKYSAPKVTDFGQIGQHTFGGLPTPACMGQGMPRKDTRTCTKDCFSDESCASP